MKKLTILVGFCILIIPTLSAQENIKYWSDGKLTWSDFQEKTVKEGVGKFSYFIGEVSERQRYNDTTINRIRAICYQNRDSSWVNPYFKNEQYLDYNQIIFDIVEFNRRKMQYDLDRIKSILEIVEIIDLHADNCKQEILNFQVESNFGENRVIISQWKDRIKEKLLQTVEERYPKIQKSKFGYGMYAGFGSGFFTGSLGEHFSPALGMTYGFDFGYRPFIFSINVLLAWNKMLEDYSSEEEWEDGQSTNFALGDISLGYTLIDNSKVKLTPFVGYSFLELSDQSREIENEIPNIYDNSFLLGVCTEYKLRKRLKLIPGFGVKENVETLIKTRLFGARGNFYSDMKGYSINLSVSISGFGNFIRNDYD